MMKIAICQINPTMGDFPGNRDKILSFYRKAVEKGADLIVFPEMVITGYPPQDLLLERDFVQENVEILEDISNQVTVPAILGYIREEKSALYNSGAVCANGTVIYTYDKILLPTYDIFDEDRYFTPGKTQGVFELELNGKRRKIGIQICEDLWDHDYECKVTNLQKRAGAEVIINISASPYHDAQLQERTALIEEKVHENRIPFLYCNLVGAQDELIFDGGSLAYDGDGTLIGQGKYFEEDILIVDLDASKSQEITHVPREEMMYNALCLGVQDYFRKTGHADAVIGLSGGIDSALVACIAADALGAEHVHGISLPSKFSSDHSLEDACTLSENLGIHYQTITIEDTVTVYETVLEPLFEGKERNAAEENIQARIRGNILMALSNKFGWLVLSTGNKTELALGYCTLYGDMSGGLCVISDISKTDVYALSRWINQSGGCDRIPESCLTKPPSAELAPDQVDPFDYEVVSPLVDAIIEKRKSPKDLVENGADKTIVNDLYHRIRINEYKRRQAAPGLRVSSKAFGTGRRIPIVNHFNGKINN